MRRLCCLLRLAWASLRVLVDGAWSLGPDTPAPIRALWLQRNARRLAWAFGLQVEVSGEQAPKAGLILANHLGYLDILVIGSAFPCRFVAKEEVKSWPLFGRFARLGGTIFVNRESRLAVAASLREIRDALSGGELLVLFPEGTSSGGETVLPFKTSLLQTTVELNVPTVPAGLRYKLSDPRASVAEEVCYWRDMELLPHLLHLADHQGLKGYLRLGSPRSLQGWDRKEAAREIRETICTLIKHLTKPRLIELSWFTVGAWFLSENKCIT
ncbi:MAG: 1-acyl-sn-glycerol-3-phosphate acyltransferase [Blastochloris sp.]|nr:1-acyl-sn-glycerol-3-phosphate acyltransferase [Blastochloris sp.]